MGGKFARIGAPSGGHATPGIVGRAGSAAVVGLATSLFVATHTQAQVAAPQAESAPLTREEVDPARRPAPTQQKPVAPALKTIAAPADECFLRGSELKTAITEVGLKGLTAVPEVRVRADFAALLGPDRPIATVCDIQKQVRRTLEEAGYLARVEIPPQRISNGHIDLEVIEARLVGVRVRGDAGPAQRRVEVLFNALKSGRPFNIHEAEGIIIRAQQIPGIRLSATLRPADTGERGAIALEVTVARDPFEVVVGAQTLGSNAVGPVSLSGVVVGNSFTSLGDRTTLSVFQTVKELHEQTVVQLRESLWVTPQGATISFGGTNAWSRPSIPNLSLSSRSLLLSIEGNYPLLRRRSWQVNGATGFEFINQVARVSAQPLYRDRLRIFYLRADGFYQDSPRNPGIVELWQWGVDLRRGVKGLGATRSQGASTPTSRFEGAPDALVGRLQTSVDLRMPLFQTRPFVISLAGRAQFANRPLLAFEELSGGNYTIGRGFDPGTFTGDNAYGGQGELRFQHCFLGGAPRGCPYVGELFGFYDAVQLNNKDAGSLNDHLLRSAGGGARFQWAGRMQADLMAAKGLTRRLPTDAADIPKPGTRVLFNVRARF